jgi:NodT family efflux transporter outer membrane factor (OMF) lipoprotein
MTRRSPVQPDTRRVPAPTQTRWLALLTLVAVVLGSSGCITSGVRDWVNNGFKVGPNYCKPPAPVATEWIQARDADVQSRHLQDWWTVFQDETLNELIRTAYGQNLTLRVMGTRVLQARAQRSISAGNLFAQTQQVQGNYRSGTFNGHRAWINLTDFNLSWEVDVWGRIRRGIETATANLDASVENYDDALVTLLADVATNYAQYRIAQQRLKIARANVKIQEDILALVQQQERVGINKVTMLDVNQARTVLEQTRSSIPALEITLGQANDTLCTLLGMPPYDLERQLGPGPDQGESPLPNTPSWVAAGIPADLLRRRPDVRSAERQVAAQSAQIGVAAADLLPRLAINGILGYDNVNLLTLPTIPGFAGLGSPANSGFFGFFSPTFSWPILNYGRIMNNVRYQKARFWELVATYQNQVLTANREVQIPLRGFLRSQEQAKAQARAVDAAREALRIGRDQFRVGTIPFNTVFNLETTQVQQQDNLVVAQGNIVLNLINVYRALGSGWEIRLQNEICASGPRMDPPSPTDASAVSGPDLLPVPKTVEPSDKSPAKGEKP